MYNVAASVRRLLSILGEKPILFSILRSKIEFRCKKNRFFYSIFFPKKFDFILFFFRFFSFFRFLAKKSILFCFDFGLKIVFFILGSEIFDYEIMAIPRTLAIPGTMAIPGTLGIPGTLTILEQRLCLGHCGQWLFLDLTGIDFSPW